MGTDLRKEQLNRAISSVDNQTLKDFEYILINDGSPMEFEVPKWVDIVTKEHAERVIALEMGIRAAKGRWICLLDSDDEYAPNALEIFNFAVKHNLAYKLFNFGCTYHHTDGTITQRPPFKPQALEEGHEVFGGGNIVNGCFIFHNSVYKDLGGFPPPVIKDIDTSEINYGGVRDLHINTPFDFSAYAQIEFPEIRKWFMVDHEAEPHKIIKELGNPWGNDYYLFYKYTRKYHSKPIDEYPLIVHPKV